MIWSVALALLWFFAPAAGRALAGDDRFKSMALGLLVLAGSLVVPPLGLAVVVWKRRFDPWSLSALKPLLAFALLRTTPDPEPLAFADAVFQGGPWHRYAPLVYYMFKLAWWADPTAVAVGGSVAMTAFLYQALTLWRRPKESALLTLMWPTAAFQYFSHHALMFAAVWTAWRAWEEDRRKTWLFYAGLATAAHVMLGPLALAPLLRQKKFQAIAALWALYLVIRGAWPASDVLRGAVDLLTAGPGALIAKAVALASVPATLAALPTYLYILATSRGGGVYYAVALLGLAAAAAATAAVPVDTARGYVSRFLFLLLPFSGTAAWPAGLASYLLHTYFYGVPWPSG